MVSQLLDGRYQIIEIIERGDFGQTYLAKDTRRPGEPQCFVKHLRPANNDMNLINTARRLFEKEAEVLEKLGQHDQIPQLYAYFEENQEFYLVEAFIDGHSLASEILPGHPLSEEQVTTILKEILEILVFVHGHGVIHRDIKPGNLIRRYTDNKLVLTDFGSVKEIHAVQQQKSPLVRVGTVEYMPIEQFQYNPQLNSDIYAVGMIGIQSLTGLPTYELSKLRNSQNSGEGEMAWRHLALVSQELADVLDNMVRSDYRQRYQSAGEALADLKRIGDRSRSRLPKLTVYREEVERRASYRGEITVVGRKILDELRESLELSLEETEAIEDEVLNPYRKYQEKGQRYEQALTEALQQEFPLSQETRDELKRLQQLLGLTEEDTAKIEDRVIPKSPWLKAYSILLVLFKKGFKPAPRQPISDVNSPGALSTLNGNGSSPPTPNVATSKFATRQLRSEEWQVLGISLAVVLVLLTGGYGYAKWQETQNQQSEDDTATLKQIDGLYITGDYEQCLSVAGNIPNTFRFFSEVQQLLQQCQDGLTWNHASGRDFGRHRGAVGALAFSPDGKQLISGSRDRTIGIWNVETGTLIKQLEGDASAIWSVKFTSDGSKLVAGTVDWRILVWDLITEQQLFTVEHNGPVWSVALSDQTSVIASGSGDKTVKIWNLETGNLIYTLPDNTASVYAVALTPDGRTLVTGSQDQTINILDVQTGALLETLRGHTDAIRDIVITPDGNQIISASYDRTVKIWDLKTGESIKTLVGHQDAIVTLALTPDGKILATGSKDKTIKLWNLETGELINTLTGHQDEVYVVTFSPDGKTLASGSKDQTIKLWRR